MKCRNKFSWLFGLILLASCSDEQSTKVADLAPINNRLTSLANQPPRVIAGTDRAVELATTVQLNGSATDDGRPINPGVLTTTWSQVSGPATISFANPNALVTTTLFPVAGSYVLRLTANDGALSAYDDVRFTILSTHTPEVSTAQRVRIAFATAGSTVNESNPTQAIALELDCGPGGVLGFAATVIVTDLHTGSANQPADYTSTLPQQVTFPAGTADGAIRTFNLTLINDTIVETDETVRLGLSSSCTNCSLGSTTTHTLTIQDNDTTPQVANFVASEGPNGTNNPLAFLETVDLGTQDVGDGPNTGTLMRVTNNGSGPMNLATPRLTGTHINDFSVIVESTSVPLSASLLSTQSSYIQPTNSKPSPLSPINNDPGPGLALRLDQQAVKQLGQLQKIALQNFVLPALGPVTLELERRELPLTDNAKLVIDDREVEGGVRSLLGEMLILAGEVKEVRGSHVYIVFTDKGTQGFVELPSMQNGLLHIMTDDTGVVRILDNTELANLGFKQPEDFCEEARIVPGQPLNLNLQLDAFGEPPSTSALIAADTTLALETDFQFFQKFNSSTALTSYVTELIGAVSNQYFIDVQTTLSIAYLGIHTTANDGWIPQDTPGASIGDLLDAFRLAWGNNIPMQADLAHFLSGAIIGSGIAYVDVLCNPFAGFAVSASLNATIDWLTWNGQAGLFTWDFVVVAHEIGHNFGAAHTHEYCPPIDRCWNNCSGILSCSRGTLMSYCHTDRCSGGLANIDLHFHPIIANIMRARVNASCVERGMLSPGDFLQYRVQFNPLTTTGLRSSTIEFSHDAPNIPTPFRVRLQGTAE